MDHQKKSDNKTVNVYLVAAGDYHDIDFARLELLKLLAEDSRVRTQVAGDYHDLEAIRSSDFLISYTCNLIPSTEEQQALHDYVASGKRWFALHGTNSILNFLADGQVDSPEIAPVLMETLGSQFIAHPPIAPFKVRQSNPDHELVKGIAEFETDDELYLCRIHGDLELLLPQRLPEVPGEADRIEAVLIELIRQRLCQASRDDQIALSARVIGGPSRRSLIFSISFSDKF
jgi:type 1 glutamine amidotransferase